MSLIGTKNTGFLQAGKKNVGLFNLGFKQRGLGNVGVIPRIALFKFIGIPTFI